jgi:hypothetical protein
MPESALRIMPGEQLDSEEDALELTEIAAADVEHSAEVIPMHPQIMAQVAAAINAELPEEEPPLFAPESFAPESLENSTHEYAAPKASRPDFKRLWSEPMREIEPEIEQAPIPAFLLTPHQPAGNLLNELLQPEALPLRLDVATAQKIINKAVSERKPVREVLRELLGLRPAMRDEVIFELPLSEQEAEELAMHFHIRPDRKGDVATRIIEEIHKKLR